MPKLSSITVSRAALTLFLLVGGTPAVAQPAALQALWTRSDRAFDAGDYKASEAAARQAIAFASSRFGAEHRSVSRGLTDLARVYLRTDRAQEAEKLARRALAIRERAIGPVSAPAAGARTTLGLALNLLGRYEEAETHLKQAVEIQQKVKPLAPWQKGNTLRILAMTYGLQGRYREADATFVAAIDELGRATGRDGIWTLRAVRQHAGVLSRMGRHPEAEAAYKRAIAGHEQRTGKEHAELLQLLSGFAHFLTDSGRVDEAEAIFERALAAYDKAPPGSDLLRASILHGIGQVNLNRGRYADAEANLKAAIAIVEARLGTDHPSFAGMQYALAQVLGRAMRYTEAEAACRKALAVYETKLGADSAHTSRTAILLGWILEGAGRPDEAKASFERGLSRTEELFGADHPRLAVARAHRAEALMSARRDREAFQELLRASDILAKLGDRDTSAGLASSNAEYRPRTRRAVHERLMAIAWRSPDVASAGSSAPVTAIDAAFMAAQQGAETSTSTAIAQMAARFSAGDSPLASLLRQAQDLALRARNIDEELIQQYGRRLDADEPAAPRDRGRAQKELEGLRAELARIDTRIRTEFPTYDELTRTRAVSIAQIQELLAPDEAMITVFAGNNATYVWAISRSASKWHRLVKPELEARVETLRCGLEVAAWTEPGRRDRCKALGLELQYPGVLPFDLGAAHKLYVDLFGPVADVIAGRRLIVVPSGALTSLPLQVLVTSPPANPFPPGADYAKADWLVKASAISTIPTVSSLRALRTAPTAPPAAKPLIGYGAPLFSSGDQPVVPLPGAARGGKATVAKAAAPTAGKSAGLSSRSAKSSQSAARTENRAAQLASGLQPLPETATELQRVASLVGAQGATVVLGASASESHVKGAPLKDYRIVYFATHGLVADEVDGLSEPALALTAPRTPTPGDDGLLTASEVAQLRLNADWVVLSACNTAAGAKTGAEALSGLARAFFHAGARAMLVSHWRVYSEAALALSTGTFEELTADPAIGRDEALRRSMLKLANGPNPETVVPAYWAPFVVVGDGRGR